MGPRRASRLGSVLTITLAVLAVILATGCAHSLSQPMPEVKGRLALKVSTEAPSTASDMPLGVHRIPDTSVYVSGHQEAVKVGAFFGLIGLAVAHAADKGTGEKKAQDAREHLRIDMRSAAQRALAEALEQQADPVRFAPEGVGDGTIEIIPYLVLTYVSEQDVQPWVVLKTVLRDSRGDEKWKTRYIAGTSEGRPLAGKRGWVSEEGAPLRTAVDRDLRTTVELLLRDATGQLPRGTGPTVKVKANWVFVKQPMETKVHVLHETEETLIVVPDVMDGIVFAGVNVLRKKSVEMLGPAK